MTRRAILFDKDGTFVDFNATWGPAIESAMRTMAAGDADAFARLCSANHYDPARRRLAPTSPFIAEASADFALRWADALGVAMTSEFHRRMDGLLDAGALAHAEPIGDPADVFATLRAMGYLVGVITNDTEAGARAQCAKLGLADLVDDVIGYDSGHGRKPGPGQILAFADRHGVPPAAMMMVGDTTHDLHAARAAAVTAIGVLSGFAGRETLAPLADHVLPDLMHLPAFLAARG